MTGEDEYLEENVMDWLGLSEREWAEIPTRVQAKIIDKFKELTER